MPVTRPDWSAVCEAVATWLETESDLPCFWRDDRQPAVYRHGAGVCLLHWQQVRRTPLSSTDWEYDATAAAGAEILPRQHDLLIMDLQVAVRSWSDAPGQHATILAQTALQRLHLRHRQAVLDAQGVSFMSVGPVTSLEWQQDGRRFSQATFTLSLCARQVYVDTDNPAGYINDVEYSIDGVEYRTDPAITTWQLGNADDTLTYQTNQAGTLYWYALVYPSATPTPATIKASGTAVPVTTAQGTIDVSALTDSTLYTVYGLLDDGTLESGVVQTTNVTADGAIPANAVTYLGEVVTYQGDVVTYTPNLVTYQGEPVTYQGENVTYTP